MDTLDGLDFPVSYPLGSLQIHERVLDDDEKRVVINEPIGFVHFKDKDA